MLTTKCLIAAGLVALMAAVPASAATIVGQTFVPDGNSTSNYTSLQASTPGHEYVVPSAGILTSWSFQAAATNIPQNMKFKVARPGGGNTYTIVGDSTAKTPAPGLNTFTEISIPVQPGDVLGFYTGSVDGAFVYDGSATSQFTESEFNGDVPPGGPPTTFDGPYTLYRLDISATLEADCDGDGLGDETEDPLAAGGTCPNTIRALSLDANKNTVKKGKKVRLSGRLDAPADRTACEAAQSVSLERKQGGQFAPVATATTDGDGDYSAKLKVKKPSTFRASVGLSSTCGSGVSDTEKVALKK